MEINTFFEVRMRTSIGGQLFACEFTAQGESDLNKNCCNVYEGASKFDGMELELHAVMIHLYIGEHRFDDGALALFERACAGHGLQVEHNYNRKMGWFDPLNRVLTPLDCGIVIPDGSIRVLWEADEASIGFDEALVFCKTLLRALIEMKSTAYCYSTEDEFNDCDTMGQERRREEFLYELGLLADRDGDYKDIEDDAHPNCEHVLNNDAHEQVVQKFKAIPMGALYPRMNAA